jgi:hypothetical protein
VELSARIEFAVVLEVDVDVNEDVDVEVEAEVEMGRDCFSLEGLDFLL